MLVNLFCILNLVSAQGTLRDRANSAFQDLGSIAESANSQVKSYTGSTAELTDPSLGGPVNEPLGKLVGQIRQSDGLVEAWGNSPGFEKNGLDSDTIEDSFDALTSLFSSLTHAYTALNTSASPVLNNVVFAVEEIVGDLSPRFDCDQLESWDSLETMLYSMGVMVISYSLNVSIQSSILGSCSPSWVFMQTFSSTNTASADKKSEAANREISNTHPGSMTTSGSQSQSSNAGTTTEFSLWAIALFLA